MSDDEIDKLMFRASHLCECSICGKEYWDHPLVGNTRDFQGTPFLNFICDGSIVKL